MTICSRDVLHCNTHNCIFPDYLFTSKKSWHLKSWHLKS